MMGTSATYIDRIVVSYFINLSFLGIYNFAHIIDNLNLQAMAKDKIYHFLFICSPISFMGATASPVSPVAIV